MPRAHSPPAHACGAIYSAAPNSDGAVLTCSPSRLAVTDLPCRALGCQTQGLV